MSDDKLTARQLYQMASQVNAHNRTAQRLGEIMAAAEKKKRMRRFTWCRAENAVFDDDLWRLVAQRAGGPLHLVEAMVLRLDLYASKNKPRGSLEGFSIAALAARWSIPNAALLARIYAAMEDPEIGWIDQDHLVTFFTRNPDLEDPTNAERQRRLRARRKEKKQDDAAAAGEVIHRNALRPLRNAQTRSDVFKKEAAAAVDNSAVSRAGGAAPGLSDAGASGTAPPANNGDNGENQDGTVDPQLWLVTEGRRIVIERLDVNGTLADVRLERWLRELAGDHAALAEIVHAADAADYMGARFHNLVVDQVKRRAHAVEGQRTLPLGPAPMTGASLGRRTGER